MKNEVNYKIRVLSEEHSIEVQKLAFELGYDWFISGNKVSKFTDTFYLFLISCGDNKGISWSNDEKYFKENSAIEITITDLKNSIILRRNDVSDATHEDYQKNNWLVIGKDKYIMQDGKWELREYVQFLLLKVDEKEPKLDINSIKPENVIKVDFFNKYLNGMKVQYQLGLQKENSQWHNLTHNSLNVLMRSNIRLREAPTTVEIDGKVFKSQKEVLTYLKNNTTLPEV